MVAAEKIFCRVVGRGRQAKMVTENKYHYQDHLIYNRNLYTSPRRTRKKISPKQGTVFSWISKKFYFQNGKGCSMISA